MQTTFMLIGMSCHVEFVFRGSADRLTVSGRRVGGAGAPAPGDFQPLPTARVDATGAVQVMEDPQYHKVDAQLER